MSDTSKDQINNLVRAYRSLCNIPTINWGQITHGINLEMISVQSEWKQRNIELGEMTKFQKNFALKTVPFSVIYESAPTDVSNQELTRISSSEKFSCIVRKVYQENKSKQFIEIWNLKGLQKNFDVSAFDVHGEIYCDGEFGTLEWSPSEEYVAYIAEKKSKKAQPFYSQKSSDAYSQDEDKSTSLSDVNIYKPEWGEQLVGKHQPVVAVCDIKSETLKVIDGIPANFSPGQLVWANDSKVIYGIALENEPRRLGLTYCTNRLSYIFRLTLKGEFKILSEFNKSVRSPRISPDGKSLFWLQRPVTGLHNGCQELVKLDLGTIKKEVVINIVFSGGKNFPGLYLHSLPTRCFSKDGTKIFFSSCNKYKNASYYLDLSAKEVHLLETGEGSSTVLDVHEDYILISSSSLQSTPSLKISKFLPQTEWIPLTKSESICQNSVFKEIEMEAKSSNQKFSYYNALFYGPSGLDSPEQKVPLVVMPHGGPHSATVDEYLLEPNFLVKIGCAVLLINYRGSTGAGQAGVEFLPGKIGDTDVKDCHDSTVSVLKNFAYLDDNNVFLYGKSHGGFLVEHLSAVYPDFYRAVVAANPVIDLYGMYIMSDITDWATGETGINFNEAKTLTVEQINKMIAVSPKHLSDKIKAPTLFLIGKNDLRVPYYEGIKQYNALKARKLKVRLHLYDDNHTVGSVPNHLDSLINTALWFFENKSERG